MNKQQDYQLLINVQQNRLKAERDADGRDNPYRLRDLCWDRSFEPASSKLVQSDRCYANAKGVLEAARIIPPGKIYDMDRAEFFLTAAKLANTAADIDLGDGTLHKSFNPRALQALQLVNAIEALGVIDSTGEVREQRIYALAGSGRVSEAADQCLSLGDQRGNVGRYMFLKARIFGALRADDKKNTDVVLDALKKAFAAGFEDVKRCSSCEDLKDLARFNSDKYRPLIAVSGKAHYISPYSSSPSPRSTSASSTNPRSRSAMFASS